MTQVKYRKGKDREKKRIIINNIHSKRTEEKG